MTAVSAGRRIGFYETCPPVSVGLPDFSAEPAAMLFTSGFRHTFLDTGASMELVVNAYIRAFVGLASKNWLSCPRRVRR